MVRVLRSPTLGRRRHLFLGDSARVEGRRRKFRACAVEVRAVVDGVRSVSSAGEKERLIAPTL